MKEEAEETKGCWFNERDTFSTIESYALETEDARERERERKKSTNLVRFIARALNSENIRKHARKRDRRKSRTSGTTHSTIGTKSLGSGRKGPERREDAGVLPKKG